MNTKVTFPAYGSTVTAFIFLCFFSGCSTSCNRSGLSAKESRMDEEFIRGQVLRYKAEAEKELSEMSEFYFQSCAPIDSPYTPEMSASIATALAALAEDKKIRGIMFDYSMSLDRYFLFYEKLKEKGGDMRGLEIDFQTPLQEKYYSPPIDDPQVPAPEPKTVAGI